MKLLAKVKNALKGANKFGIAAILVAGVMAFSFKPDPKRVGTYRYTQPTQQNWSATMLDQNASHYEPISASTASCEPSDKICSYDLVNGEFVKSTQGDYSE